MNQGGKREYLVKTIDECLHADGGRGCRPAGLVLCLRGAAGEAGADEIVLELLSFALLLLLALLRRRQVLRDVAQVLARRHLIEQLVLALRQSQRHLLREVQQLLQILQLLRAPRQLRLRPLLQLCRHLFSF